MKALLKNKQFLIFYGIWIFLHSTLLLMAGDSLYEQKHNFWPFTSESLYDTYDVSEWFVYVLSPILIIFIIRYRKNG